RCDGEPGAASPVAHGGGALDPRLRPAGTARGGARGSAPLTRRDGRRVGGVSRFAYGPRDAARRGRVAQAGLHARRVQRDAGGGGSAGGGAVSARGRGGGWGGCGGWGAARAAGGWPGYVGGGDRPGRSSAGSWRAS